MLAHPPPAPEVDGGMLGPTVILLVCAIAIVAAVLGMTLGR